MNANETKIFDMLQFFMFCAGMIKSHCSGTWTKTTGPWLVWAKGKVVVGDVVLTVNGRTGKKEWKRVTKVIRSTTTHLREDLTLVDVTVVTDAERELSQVIRAALTEWQDNGVHPLSQSKPVVEEAPVSAPVAKVATVRKSCLCRRCGTCCYGDCAAA